MSGELKWLLWTVIVTGILWVPYILDRIIVRGLFGAMANPSPDLKPQSAWAERMKAAHANSIENLVVFAVLALMINAAHFSSSTTVFACALYFWARLVYIIVYTAGIPVLRTLAFAGGFVGQVILALALLGLT